MCLETVIHFKAMLFKMLCDLWLFFSRCTILVELEVSSDKKEALNYAPGDHMGVFPGNSPELVMGILKHLPNAPPTNQSVQLEYLSKSCYGNSPLYLSYNDKLLPIVTWEKLTSNLFSYILQGVQSGKLIYVSQHALWPKHLHTFWILPPHLPKAS